MVAHTQSPFLLLLAIIINLDLQHLKHVIIEMPLSAREAGVIRLGLAGPPMGSWQSGSVLAK